VTFRDTGPAERAAHEPEALGQVLRDPPGVAARIGEGERAHAPVTIRRAADHRHSVVFQLSAHRIHVLNDDAELPDTLLLRQAEYVARRGVLVSRIVPQRDERVLERKSAKSSNSFRGAKPKTSR
jgi:hypothetical protein